MNTGFFKGENSFYPMNYFMYTESFKEPIVSIEKNLENMNLVC